MSIQEEKEFEDTVLQQLDSCSKKINRHAATLVLVCLNKLFEQLSVFLQALMTPTAHLTKDEVKKMYVLSSKLHMADFILYISFESPETDLFYNPATSDQWLLLNQHFNSHEFKNNAKVIEAYKELFKFVSIGNAIMNLQKKDDNTLVKLVKSGWHATHFFFLRTLENNKMTFSALTQTMTWLGSCGIYQKTSIS